MFYRGYVYGCGDVHVCVCDDHCVCATQSAGQQNIKVEQIITENSTIYTEDIREDHNITFYLDSSLSFMMVSLFVSVMMFMLVHQGLQAGWWGPGQGEIFPENTGEKRLVLTGEPGGGGWQEKP